MYGADGDTHGCHFRPAWELISATVGTTDPLADAVINEHPSDLIPFPSNSSEMAFSKLICTGGLIDGLRSDFRSFSFIRFGISVGSGSHSGDKARSFAGNSFQRRT
jgi:hypothetical protein